MDEKKYFNEITKFESLYGKKPEMMITAPGRTELCGNHTDHQHGKVLAGPVDLTANAFLSLNGSNVIRVYSEGYDFFELDVSDTQIHEAEFGRTIALVRGVAAHFVPYGLKGFDAYMTSDIPAGSGLSSSAAMEILLGRICAEITGVEKTCTELAILGQYVENNYFGKPCGLMDQMACAARGVISIDFKDPQSPVVKEVEFDFKKAGYSLCIIKCGAGHENLTDNYAAITMELKQLCNILGADYLRDVDEEVFYSRILELRNKCGDRAVLRAMHVYEDNKRVEAQINALMDNDIDRYLELVKESGRSSWELLQNVIPENEVSHQDMAFSIAMAEKILNGRGAVRVHGGGFAGTIQAYVPNDMTEEFRDKMDSYLGDGSCIYVNIGA